MTEQETQELRELIAQLNTQQKEKLWAFLKMLHTTKEAEHI